MRHAVACDTGVLFSGLFWGGKPGRVLEAVEREEALLLISEYIRDELAAVIAEHGLGTGSLEKLLRLDNVRVIGDGAYASRENFDEARRFVRDAADRPVYAFFLELLKRSQADFFVSSDADLLEIARPSPLFGKIVTPARYCEEPVNRP